MKNKKYKFTVCILLVTYLLFSVDKFKEIFRRKVLNQFFNNYYDGLLVNDVIILFLAFSILFIGIYFSTYIKLSNEIILKPKLIFFIGFLFVSMALFNSTSSYMALSYLSDELPVFSEKNKEKVKVLALTKNKCADCSTSNGYTIAEVYYKITGEVIDYSNINDQTITFVPNSSNIKDREKLLNKKPKHTYLKRYVKTVYYLNILMCIILVATGFILRNKIKYKFHNKMLNKDCCQATNPF